MVAEEKGRMFNVKAYRKKELIDELGVTSSYEFDKIIKPHSEKIGKRMGHYYTPKQSWDHPRFNSDR